MARVSGTFTRLRDRRDEICVAGLVELHTAFGLKACAQCGAPFCRECGEHATYVHSLAPLPGEAGYECACGWAIEWPHFG